ncbi:penicillin acylase family protein [Phytohabitans rumicis]|uniref:Penicillin amidase n=1 Tax=Phytohabitans rumicis TaxID=1076125 RepID=A0A6V8LI87_9ACTN|nr:penicillin acylase family protein [Phytohabitans rumicis]GFJ93856.1 hypothetical protein Prum_074980 [Phytohabitans rumicis]
MKPAGAAVLIVAALVVTTAPAGAVAAKPATPVAGVVRDQFGLAHVRAGNRHELFFLQGWVHAQDRLFQMDLNRRETSGTLAELLGDAAIPQDVQFRTFGVRRAAQRSLAALSASTRRDLTSYTEGVNRWVAQHPLPAQYAAAGARSFVPWQPLDSVTALKWISFQVSLFDGLRDLSSTVALQAAMAAGAAGGFDGGLLFAEDAYRSQPFTSAASVPDATRAPAPTTAKAAGAGNATAARVDPARLADAARLSARWLAAAGGLDALVPLLAGERRRGSNEWVVSGARTTTGRPLLVNDPHLGLGAPSTHLLAAFDRARRSADPTLRALGGNPAVVEAAGRLRGWDFTTPTGVRRGYDAGDTYRANVPSGPSAVEKARSVNATVYSAWRSQILRDAIDAPLASLGLPPPGGDIALADLRILLEGRPQPGVGATGIDFFAVPGIGDHAVARDVVLLRSLARALDALAGPDYAPAFAGSHDQRDYRWGQLHRIVLDSPLGPAFSVPRVPGPFPPSIPGLPGLSVDGAYGTVDAAYHNVRATTAADYMFSDGPARRYIVEVTSTGPRGVDSLAGDIDDGTPRHGQTDLLSRYLVNEHYPLL